MRSLDALAAGTAVAVLLTASVGGRFASAAYAPGYGPGIISVIVRDAAGRPAAGAIVEASGPAKRSATTPASGIVTFSGIPTGRYVVRASTAREEAPSEIVVVTTAPGRTAASRALQFVALQLAPEGIVEAPDPHAATFVPVALGEALPAFALAARMPLDLTGLTAGSGVRASGGDSRGVRESVDGIPLPDALRGSLALAAMPGLVTGFAATRGAHALGSVSDPGTGGVLELLTQPLGSNSGVFGAAGAADFGTIATLGADARTGPLAAGARFGSAPSGVRDRVAQARVRLSPVTVVDGEAYRLDDADGLAAGPFWASVRGASIVTTLGAARLSLQSYESAFSLAGSDDDDRLHGIALRYDGTFGPSRLDVWYARDGESARYGNGTSASAEAERLGTSAEYELSPAVRAVVVTTLARGDLIGRRSDVGSTVRFTLTPAWILRLGAGSGSLPAPLDLVAARSLAAVRTPESTFDASASLAYDRAQRRVAFAAYATHVRDRFAARAEARATGLSASYAIVPVSGLGLDVEGALARVAFSGADTPERDPATTGLARALGLDASDAAFAALRGSAHVSFRTLGGLEATLGAAYLDAPNGLAPTALVLGDAAIAVPLARGPAPLAIRLSARDVFGGSLGGAPLAPSGPPAGRRRDVELTLERPNAP